MSFGWWRIHFNCFFSNRFCKCQATTVATSRKMKMGLFENKLPVIILFPVKNFKHHLGCIHHFQTDLNWFEDILKLNQHDPSPWFMSSLPLGPDCTRKQESNSEWIESFLVEPPWIAQNIGVSINISVFFAGVSYWLFSLLKSGHGSNKKYFVQLLWHWQLTSCARDVTYVSMQQYWMPLWITWWSPLNTSHYGAKTQ